MSSSLSVQLLKNFLDTNTTTNALTSRRSRERVLLTRRFNYVVSGLVITGPLSATLVVGVGNLNKAKTTKKRRASDLFRRQSSIDRKPLRWLHQLSCSSTFNRHHYHHHKRQQVAEEEESALESEVSIVSDSSPLSLAGEELLFDSLKII